MSNKNYLPGVITIPVQGVAVERHQLDVELHRLAHLLRSVGKRLQRVMRAARPGEGQADETLPEGTQELMSWHSKTLLGLLAEQRHRARMQAGSGLETLSDEDYDREIRELACDTIMEMPEDELNQLLAQRERVR